MNRIAKNLRQIVLRGKNTGYKVKRFDDTILLDKDDIRLIVFPRNRKLSVISKIKHPKKGRTKLLRERLNFNEVTWIMYYPRVHSKKGKYIE